MPWGVWGCGALPRQNKNSYGRFSCNLVCVCVVVEVQSSELFLDNVLTRFVHDKQIKSCPSQTKRVRGASEEVIVDLTHQSSCRLRDRSTSEVTTYHIGCPVLPLQASWASAAAAVGCCRMARCSSESRREIFSSKKTRKHFQLRCSDGEDAASPLASS